MVARASIRIASLLAALSLATNGASIANELSPSPLDRTPAHRPPNTIDLGQRPLELVASMSPGPLRDRLAGCSQGPFRATRFSIGHRGAPLRYPEHTRAAYRAAARMGAGSIECDVTHTADGIAVCRHSQCDLATTTNLLETALAAKCREPFRAADFDPATGALTRPASALCCTSDLTLAEIRRLKGRMDVHDPTASSVSAFLAPSSAHEKATPHDDSEHDLRIVTHAESIALFRELGVAMIPENKADSVARTRRSGAAPNDVADFARSVLEAYREAGIPPERVRLQSFEADDLRHWLRLAPAYGARAVWLVEDAPDAPPPTQAEFDALYAEGFRALGPSIPMLLRVDDAGELRATEYARRARRAGFELFAWTIERSGVIRNGQIDGGRDDFYLGPLLPALENEGDLFAVIHALAEQAKVSGVFSDWPATTTYYANCFGLD